MKLLIILLFPITLCAQSGKVQLRKQIAPAVMVFVAGMADGLNQLTTYHYKNFKRAFPGANDQFWYAPSSFTNKYKNHDPAQGAKFPGSTTFGVFLTDGYHLTRFCERLFLSGAFAFKIVQGEKMKWYWYALEAMGYLFINRLGFVAVYNTIK